MNEAVRRRKPQVKMSLTKNYSGIIHPVFFIQQHFSHTLLFALFKKKKHTFRTKPFCFSTKFGL